MKRLWGKLKDYSLTAWLTAAIVCSLCCTLTFPYKSRNLYIIPKKLFPVQFLPPGLRGLHAKNVAP